MAHHLASPVIAGVCQSLQYCYAANLETFLRAVLDKSADKDAQGQACFTLAKVLEGRAEYVDRIRDGDASLRTYLEQSWGKPFVEKLLAAGSAPLAKEAEALFVRVTEKYADVARGSLADQAKTDLFELRNLSIGKAAPEIVGTDVAGKPIKLSDFRGKVVMLDFWGFW